MFRKNAICGIITESLYLEMGQQIVNGSFLLDTPIFSEDSVCHKFKVSRSVSREAVKILAAKGLIASRSKTGIEINHMDQWNLFDRDVLNWITSGDLLATNFDHICQIRKLVEPEAIRELCNSGDSKSISILKDIVNKMQIQQDNQHEFRKCQVLFHTAVINTSGNPFFKPFSELIINTLGKSEKGFKKLPSVQLLQYYTEMLEAIEHKHQNAAASLCKTIVESAAFTEGVAYI